MLPRHAIGPPARSGGDADVLKAEVEDLRGIKARGEVGLDIGPLRQLILAVIDHPPPSRKPRQLALAGHAPADLAPRLGDRHIIAAQGQGPRRFEASRAGAYDQDILARPLGVHPLGMPAAPPFLHPCGVLRAAAHALGHVAGDADIAADAFADVLYPALFDLFGQEGIGDRGPRTADEIERPLPDHPRHHIGAGEAADAHDRLARKLADATHKGLLRGLFLEARGARAIFPRPVRQIPKVGQIAVHLDEIAHFGVGEAKIADGLIKRDPQRKGHRLAHRLAHIGDHLAGKAGAVF